MTTPFKIESSDINRLNDIQLTQLLKELLHAEAYKFGIIQRAVEVALNIRVGDGGEDGRISWNYAQPKNTDYIPNRLSMFQNKATKMDEAGYASEIMTAARPKHPSRLKSKVEEVLDGGGAYIVFTTQELNHIQISKRIAAIRKKLKDQGKGYADTCQIDIYDAARIAGWTNQFISTIVSVQYWVGRRGERGLKTYELWSEHEDLARLPFAPVDSRNDMMATLAHDLPTPKSCFRLMGLSGLGKTRTAFQLFKENQTIRSMVVYVDANYGPDIPIIVADFISLGLRAILVVDNCEYRLHERLVKEVRREPSEISLLTLDYDLDRVSPPTICFKLDQVTDEELLQLLSPVYKDRLPDLDRIVGFAQGFPQMAVLLAEARLADDPRIGELTDDELADKLLWKRGEVENKEYKKVLQVCSLFDAFGIEKEAEKQLEYIAHVAGVDIDTVYECIQTYSDRGLIDRRGRFGQVVPKPLAIRLAGQWWEKSREQKQRALINGIPESMIEVFCSQVGKMDFHPDVKSLTENLCGQQGLFGQAEVILSDRGSRLFRAFVNVNPEATSSALSGILCNLSHQQLLVLDGGVRRNLVWSLEMLCFHAYLFEDAAWCMLLLSSAENETWGNNATGMFSQLFRVNLSGTAANPSTRFSLLRRGLNVNKCNFDLPILNALENAISVYGGSRAVGAEHQGTKAPLLEWKPTIWQEIFDYWQEAFDILLLMLERGDVQKERAMTIIGHSIRGFVSRGRIDMLESAIKRVVEVNGRYWPAALESIKNALAYNSKDLKGEAIDALNSWLELLNPDHSEIPEKLKILVINPPRENRNGSDGIYVDIAAENSIKLAQDIAGDVQSIFPYLEILLIKGEQRQSYVFGRQLVIELSDSTELIDTVLKQLVSMDESNINFILGIFSGIHEKSPDTWQLFIDKIVEDKKLVIFYPDLIRTGSIKKCHLDRFLELMRQGVVSANSSNALSYGSVTEGVAPDVISEFCLELSTFGNSGAWAALNIIFHYCFINKKLAKHIRDQLKVLILAAPLHKDQNGVFKDVYHWREMCKIILATPDQEFAIDIAHHAITACKHGFNHDDLWNYIKPLLSELVRCYGESLWPIFSTAIVNAKGIELYWLQQLLDRESQFSNQQPSVLTLFPANMVISWCKEYPEIGPNYVATCINIFETDKKGQRPLDLFIDLLVNFGNDNRVTSALTANMDTRGWTGSLVPYLEKDKESLYPLLDHESWEVKNWVRQHIAQIDRQIKYEANRDDEHSLGIY